MNSNLPKKYHITAGCVLLDKYESNANVLLIHRIWESAPKGAYILPKGHIENGESAEEAAIRETIEETGYQNMRIVQPLPSTKIVYEKDGFLNTKEIQWFLAVLTNDKKEGIELTETEEASQEFSIDWYPLQKSIELVNASPLDADKPAINALKTIFEL